MDNGSELKFKTDETVVGFTAIPINEVFNFGFGFQPALVAEHAAWSDETFGTPDVKGPVGPLKHLSKEAIEAAENPQDITEFADMAFLFLEGMRRGGHSWDDLNDAMWLKLQVLKGRDYKTNQTDDPDEAVQHHEA